MTNPTALGRVQRDPEATVVAKARPPRRGTPTSRRGGWCQRAPAPLPLPTAPSCARRPRAATFGFRRARDDPRVIVPARRLLLRRLVGDF